MAKIFYRNKRTLKKWRSNRCRRKKRYAKKLPVITRARLSTLLFQAKENKNNIVLINKSLSDISQSVTDFHKSVNEIVLNGDGRVRTLQEVLKEIYSATRSLRASAGLFASLRKWKRETKAGMFFTSWFGIVFTSVIIVLLFYCVLQTIGITHITLTELFKAAWKIFF